MVNHRCAMEIRDPEIRRMRARNDEPMICNLTAHYLIDGVPMCRRHAGFAVLESLINGERPNVGRIAAALLVALLAAVLCCAPIEAPAYRLIQEIEESERQ